MAARHHASKKARRKEHMAMERYERGPVKPHSRRMHVDMVHESGREAGYPSQHPDMFNDEYHHDRQVIRGMYRRGLTAGEMYAGMEPRRRQELEDAGMIHEDHNAIANMPQNVMIKKYPKTGPYNPEILDDTIESVDAQMDYDDSQRARHFNPKKV